MDVLEAVARRQAAWSAAAGSLKSTLERTRRGTLALSILGAVLATCASQLDGNPRWWLALWGTIVFALGAFLTSRVMTASRLEEWVRARAASEALKREAFKYAAKAAPYDDEATRHLRFKEESGKIEAAAADLATGEAAAKPSGSTPSTDLAPDDYIARRIGRQVEGFYRPRAETYRRRAMRLGWAELGCALAATIVTAVMGAVDKQALPGHFDLIALASVLTTISGAIAAHVEASRYNFLAATYRATARRLESELAAARTPFSAPSAEWSAFVDRCETIIADENGAWLAKWTG